MERLDVLAPALVPAAYFIGAFVLFSGMCMIGRRPDGGRGSHSRFFTWLIDYFYWMLRPVLDVSVKLQLSPNQLTIASLLVCAGAGLAIGAGYLATAGWLYVGAGALDVLDGWLARATGKQTRAGAFLDSVTDRWAELFVHVGFAWLLRDSLWLLAVMLATAGSMMTSYTRARGEALGVELNGGLMQRPERIALVSVGTLIAAWFDAARATAQHGRHIIGVCLLLVGIGATATAIHRYVSGYRSLRRAEGEPDVLV